MLTTVQWTELKSSAIQTALDCQKANLERLSLSHAEYYPIMHDSGDEIIPMSFSEFKALKQLRIAPIYLYGEESLQLQDGEATRSAAAPHVSQEDIESTRGVLVDALPRQLETLTLVHCEDPSTLDRVIVSLHDLLICKEFSRLRGVSIYGSKLERLNEKLEALKILPWAVIGVRFIVKVKTATDYAGNKFHPKRWGWDGEVEWGQCVNDYRGLVDVIYDSEVKR
jgi:hypothetical protein